MAVGPINQAALESNYQNPGDIYLDTKTEGAFQIVVDQVNQNAGIFAAGGSSLIVSDPITGVTGTNVYSQLAFIESQVQSLVGGVVPPSTVTTAMLQNGAVTLVKLEDSVQDSLSAVQPMMREIANLKAQSTIANRVDGASGIFYDLMDDLNDGSIGQLDTTRTNVVGTLSAGATTCTVKSAIGLVTGMEITFQDIINETVRERKVITVSGTTLTFSALANSYTDKAVVYRSLVSVSNSQKTMSFGKALYPALESLVKMADPATLPTQTGQAVAYSADGSYVAVGMGTGGNFLVIYKISNGVWTKLSDPATLPTAAVNNLSWSADGTYLAAAHGITPYITIYKRSGDTFTKLANPSTLPNTNAYSVAFSPDGNYLAVGNNAGTPILNVYKRSGDTFTDLAFGATMPGTGLAYSAAWSPDSIYLAIGTSNSTGTLALSLYKRTGDTFAKLTTPATQPNNAIVRGLSFSSDGVYLAMALAASPYILVHKRSGDTFTKLSDPSTLPSGQANGCVFSQDTTYVALAINVSPFITIYKRSGDTFTKLSDPSTLPTITSGLGISVTNDIQYVTVSGAGTPFVTSYSGGTGIDVLQADARYNINPPANVSTIVSWVDHETDANYAVTGAVSFQASGGNENFVAMTKTTKAIDATHNEDQFIGSGTSLAKSTLRYTLNRNSTALTKTISQVTGAVGQ